MRSMSFWIDVAARLQWKSIKEKRKEKSKLMIKLTPNCCFYFRKKEKKIENIDKMLNIKKKKREKQWLEPFDGIDKILFISSQIHIDFIFKESKFMRYHINFAPKSPELQKTLVVISCRIESRDDCKHSILYFNHLIKNTAEFEFVCVCAQMHSFKWITTVEFVYYALCIHAS